MAMREEDLYSRIVSKYPAYANIPQAELMPRIYAKFPQYQSAIETQRQNPIIEGVKNTFRTVSTIPAAANREAIRSNPAMAIAGPFANLLSIGNPRVSQAAMNPESSQTFQDQSIQFVNDQINKINPQAGTASRFIAGIPASAVGLAADIATDPSAALLALAGKTPTGGGRNLGALIGESKAGQALTKIGNTDVTTAPMNAVTRPIRKVFGRLNEGEVNKVIDEGIAKGIRPTVVGKNSATQYNKFKDDYREAVKQIIQNKDKITLLDDAGEVIPDGIPKNLQHFSDAISQTKKSIFNQYSGMAKQAGEDAVRIPTEQFARNVEKAAQNKTVQIRFPALGNYMNDLAGRLRAAKSFAPEELEDFIASLNNSLKAFYKNPNYAAVDQSVVDAALATQMRTALDDAIEGGYKGLKKAYGALRSIEADVTKRAIVDARKNNRGFFDLADIVSSGDIVQGLLKMDPSQIAKGTVQRSLVSYFKFLNNPNRAIKNMFSTIEKSVPAGKVAQYYSKFSQNVEAVEPVAQKLLSAPQGQKVISSPSRKMIGVDPIFGEGFERVSPQEAFNRIRAFAFKYWSPTAKKIEIPEGVVFGTKTESLMKKMGINPITGEIKSAKAKTALQTAIARSKKRS